MFRFGTIGLLVLALLFFLFSCSDMRLLEDAEHVGTYPSPNGDYALELYVGDGGATVDFSTFGILKEVQSGKRRMIYHQYHCSDAKVFWQDETHFSINGVELTTRSFKYKNLDRLN